MLSREKKRTSAPLCPIMNGNECIGHRCTMAICRKALCEGMNDIWYCGLIASTQNLQHPVDQTEPKRRSEFL